VRHIQTLSVHASRVTALPIKYRVNRGQELVIGGYIPGPHGFDSLKEHES